MPQENNNKTSGNLTNDLRSYLNKIPWSLIFEEAGLWRDLSANRIDDDYQIYRSGPGTRGDHKLLVVTNNGDGSRFDTEFAIDEHGTLDFRNHFNNAQKRAGDKIEVIYRFLNELNHVRGANATQNGGPRPDGTGGWGWVRDIVKALAVKAQERGIEQADMFSQGENNGAIVSGAQTKAYPISKRYQIIPLLDDNLEGKEKEQSERLVSYLSGKEMGRRCIPLETLQKVDKESILLARDMLKYDKLELRANNQSYIGRAYISKKDEQLQKLGVLPQAREVFLQTGAALDNYPDKFFNSKALESYMDNTTFYFNNELRKEIRDIIGSMTMAEAYANPKGKEIIAEKIDKAIDNEAKVQDKKEMKEKVREMFMAGFFDNKTEETFKKISLEAFNLDDEKMKVSLDNYGAELLDAIHKLALAEPRLTPTAEQWNALTELLTPKGLVDYSYMSDDKRRAYCIDKLNGFLSLSKSGINSNSKEYKQNVMPLRNAVIEKFKNIFNFPVIAAGKSIISDFSNKQQNAYNIGFPMREIGKSEILGLELKGFTYADMYENGKKVKKIVGFKGNAKDSQKEGTWAYFGQADSNKCKKIFMCESSLDALSFYAVEQEKLREVESCDNPDKIKMVREKACTLENTLFIDNSGIPGWEAVKTILQQYPKAQIIMGFDRDTAGKEADLKTNAALNGVDLRATPVTDGYQRVQLTAGELCDYRAYPTMKRIVEKSPDGKRDLVFFNKKNITGYNVSLNCMRNLSLNERLAFLSIMPKNELQTIAKELQTRNDSPLYALIDELRKVIKHPDESTRTELYRKAGIDPMELYGNIHKMLSEYSPSGNNEENILRVKDSLERVITYAAQDNGMEAMARNYLEKAKSLSNDAVRMQVDREIKNIVNQKRDNTISRFIDLENFNLRGFNKVFPDIREIIPHWKDAISIKVEPRTEVVKQLLGKDKTYTYENKDWNDKLMCVSKAARDVALDIKRIVAATQKRNKEKENAINTKIEAANEKIEKQLEANRDRRNYSPSRKR